MMAAPEACARRADRTHRGSRCPWRWAFARASRSARLSPRCAHTATRACRTCRCGHARTLSAAGLTSRPPQTPLLRPLVARGWSAFRIAVDDNIANAPPAKRGGTQHAALSNGSPGVLTALRAELEALRQQAQAFFASDLRWRGEPVAEDAGAEWAAPAAAPRPEENARLERGLVLVRRLLLAAKVVMHGAPGMLRGLAMLSSRRAGPGVTPAHCARFA
jgi:hypothetical protein